MITSIIHNLNNIISFLIFNTLSIIFKKNMNNNTRHILFFNGDKIGDLVISSLLLTNDETVSKQNTVYYLVRREYSSLFKDYEGPVIIIYWDYNRYKYNPIYRMMFLSELHSYKFDKCINISSARRILYDEVALLAGAHETYALRNKWKTVINLFAKQMDGYFTKIIDVNTNQEYSRIKQALEYLFAQQIKPNITVFISEKTQSKMRKEISKYWPQNKEIEYVTVAPLSDMPIRNWEIEKYKTLCEKIIKDFSYKIILLGNKKQYTDLEKIKLKYPSWIINTSGKYDIVESAAIIQQSSLFIGNDSGLTHIAKALKKNYVGIIGGGCYGMFFPYMESDIDHIISNQMDCFGCEWRCKYAQPLCITEIKIDEVYYIVKNILNTIEHSEK